MRKWEAPLFEKTIPEHRWVYKKPKRIWKPLTEKPEPAKLNG